MGTKEQLEQRRKQWAAFNRWEAEQIAPERTPAEIIADLGAILDWLPREVCMEDPDPQKRGIRKIREALAKLKTRP